MVYIYFHLYTSCMYIWMCMYVLCPGFLVDFIPLPIISGFTSAGKIVSHAIKMCMCTCTCTLNKVSGVPLIDVMHLLFPSFSGHHYCSWTDTCEWVGCTHTHNTHTPSLLSPFLPHLSPSVSLTLPSLPLSLTVPSPFDTVITRTES